MNAQAWIESLRLKTLPLAVASILIGSALSYWSGIFHIGTFILTLLTASSLQILSNLANDYGDMVKGSDENRIGPLRGIQKGQITLPQLKKGLIVITVISIIFGLALLFTASNNLTEIISFILLGLISIIAAITYTIGKKPYGYIGLGDLSVLIFFGFISVMGSYYLQTKSLSLFLIYPSIACGLLSVAVLNINNLRDYNNDKLNHKRTLIVLMGQSKGKYYHSILLLITYLCITIFSLQYLHSYARYLYLLSIPYLIIHLREIFTAKESVNFRPLLEQMVKLALLISFLFGISILLD